MDIPIPLQEALRDSITSGTFIDAKFWVFSKRSSKTGRVGEPKALFVNGHVVRSVPRLGACMLSSLNFRVFLPDHYAVLDQHETKQDLRTIFPADKQPHIGDYDYDADSDLEEDEDCDFSDDWDVRPPPVDLKGKNDGSDSSTLVGSQNPEVVGDKSPDIISVSDMDSLFSEPVNAKPEAEPATTPTPTHVGTVVVIEDAAFVT
jgi:hypothetical protein